MSSIRISASNCPKAKRPQSQRRELPQRPGRRPQECLSLTLKGCCGSDREMWLCYPCQTKSAMTFFCFVVLAAGNLDTCMWALGSNGVLWRLLAKFVDCGESFPGACGHLRASLGARGPVAPSNVGVHPSRLYFRRKDLPTSTLAYSYFITHYRTSPININKVLDEMESLGYSLPKRTFSTG